MTEYFCRKVYFAGVITTALLFFIFHSNTRDKRHKMPFAITMLHSDYLASMQEGAAKC